MIRAILCRVGERSCVTSLSPDSGCGLRARMIARSTAAAASKLGGVRLVFEEFLKHRQGA